jgi:hypothetical protein
LCFGWLLHLWNRYGISSRVALFVGTIIFVGTLVKRFGGVSLSGGASCKWYINPQVPEAEVLMNRYGISCSYLIIFVALVDWLDFYDTIV